MNQAILDSYNSYRNHGPRTLPELTAQERAALELASAHDEGTLRLAVLMRAESNRRDFHSSKVSA